MAKNLKYDKLNIFYDIHFSNLK